MLQVTVGSGFTIPLISRYVGKCLALKLSFINIPNSLGLSLHSFVVVDCRTESATGTTNLTIFRRSLLRNQLVDMRPADNKLIAAIGAKNNAIL